MFIGGTVLLLGALAAVFWFGLPKTAPGSGLKAKLATVAVFLGLSGFTYIITGQPDYTKPRLISSNQEVGEALRPVGLGAVETYGGLVRSNAQDKEQWLDVAEDLRQNRRSIEAADALSRAAELAPNEAEQAALYGAAGETLVIATGGVVDDAAAVAFAAALKIDQESLGALYYLGRKARSEGEEQTARDYWSRFLAVAPEDHALAAEVRGNLALIGGAAPRGGQIAPVLTDEMISQFEGLSEGEQAVRIASMLARAEDRLTVKGGEAESGEWRELGRAYARIGDFTRAKAAYQEAIKIAPGDTALALEYQQIKP